MPTERKISTRLTRELLEMAKDMPASIMDDAATKKIVMRHFKGGCKTKQPLAGVDIRAPRAKARMT
jgi:hypothetical protein